MSFEAEDRLGSASSVQLRVRCHNLPHVFIVDIINVHYIQSILYIYIYTILYGYIMVYIYIYASPPPKDLPFFGYSEFFWAYVDRLYTGRWSGESIAFVFFVEV